MTAERRSIHLRIRVPEGGRKALFEFLREAIPFYEKSGGTRIRLLEDMTDPNAFIEVVEYETVEAYELGEQQVESDPKMGEYLKRWRALLDEPPVVEQFCEISDKVR